MMKWSKRLLILSIVFLAVIGLVFLVPLNSYIPEIEKRIGEKLHEPVRIGSLRILLVPTPHVVIKKITIGAQQEVKIESIEVTPALSTLFSPTKVLRNVELNKVNVDPDILEKMPGWFKPDGGPQVVRIEKVGLSHVVLISPKMALPSFGVALNMNADGGLGDARLASDDGKLKIGVKADKEAFLLDIAARKWQPPAGPALMFDELNIRGVVGAADLNLKQVDGKLYGGSVKGNAVLGWKNGWRLDGKLQSQAVELQRLVPLFSTDVSVSGRLNATTNFSMAAKDAGQLLDYPKVKATFNVQNGVLYNVDLAAAARTFSKEGMRGGKTQFDELAGTLELAGKAYRFKEIKVSSGVLTAQGDLLISPKKELDGRIKVELRKTAGMVGVPMTVSGTTKDPVLRLTSGYLAGAATGTMLLGPGLGTSLGGKAGDAIQRLFK